MYILFFKKLCSEMQSASCTSEYKAFSNIIDWLKCSWLHGWLQQKKGQMMISPLDFSLPSFGQQERYTCPSLAMHPLEDSFVAQTNGNYIGVFSSQQPYRMNKRRRYEGHKVSNDCGLRGLGWHGGCHAGLINTQITDTNSCRTKLQTEK